MIDIKRAIKQGGGDYILWLSVTCAPIDVLPPISVTCSTCWPLNFNIVSRNYCYWRMDFWQLILYPLVVNIWLFVPFHCQWMCVLLSFSFVLESSILRILLKPQLNFILFHFNFSFIFFCWVEFSRYWIIRKYGLLHKCIFCWKVIFHSWIKKSSLTL